MLYFLIGALETRIDMLEKEKKKTNAVASLNTEDYGVMDMMNKQNQVYKSLLRKNMQLKPLVPLFCSKGIKVNNKNAEINLQCRKLYQ